ncbi:hypothetical protein D9M71_325660 [compost metagenome]
MFGEPGAGQVAADAHQQRRHMEQRQYVAAGLQVAIDDGRGVGLGPFEHGGDNGPRAAVGIGPTDHFRRVESQQHVLECGVGGHGVNPMV